MKKFMRGMFAVLFMLATATGFAQDAIEGTWAGKLEVAPGTSIGVHFSVSKDASGAYRTVVNSPDSGAIKNVAASATSFDGAVLEIKVDALSGAYKGTLGGGTITGEWTQPGSTLAMNLSPYVAAVMSEETKAMLLGQWHGKLQGPGIVLNMVFHFERNEAGDFVGFIQNADASPMKQPLSDITLENDELFFRVPAANAEYKGKVSATGFDGHLKQAGMEMALNVVKGEYVAEVPTLSLTAADFEKLSGTWQGTLGPLTLVLRIERNAEGTIVAFIDSPTQGATGLRVTSAALTGTQLALALTIPPAEYKGELAGNTLTGNWIQGGMTNPLTLTKQ